MRLRGRQSLSGIECSMNDVIFLMPWAVSMERLMKFIASRLSFKLNFIAATAIIMWWIPMIVDNQGNIVFLQAGFLGSMNDAGNFILMERIGPGTACDMPRGTVLLADRGYGDFVPLLTPFWAAQIRRMPMHQQWRVRKFNRKLSQCRVIVEHTIKYVKKYQAIGALWRHPRWFQPVIVELCTFLAQNTQCSLILFR